MTAAAAKLPRPTVLVPEELSSLEQRFFRGEASPAEIEEVLEMLACRADASPTGAVSVYGVPDDDDSDFDAA